MAGIAALGGAVGEGARQGALKLMHDPDAPESFIPAITRMGESGLEQGAGDLGGRLLTKIASRFVPSRLYSGALKPPTNLHPAARNTIVQTGLRERIPVSEGGLTKLDNAAGDINSRVQSLIANANRPRMQISPSDVTAPLRDLRQRFSLRVNPGADVAAINKATSEFLDKHSTSAPYTRIAPNPYAAPGGPGAMIPTGSGTVRTPVPLSLAEAQAEKQGTYRVLAGKYGELGSADTEAQKALARGLKNEIARRVPAIGPLNQREGSLLDLREPLVRAIGREGNRNLLGLRLPVVDTPEVVSSAAIGMNRVANTPPARMLGRFNQAVPLLPLAGRAAAMNLELPSEDVPAIVRRPNP